ncbi:transglutaminase-like cysteine peptidase [Pseudomonas putida]|uniref:transglutaminase-like cysteine peptidase n=1 Tax=Pseudomonas putida TaxID=303 RepID=UPI0023656CB7|nr:transglutaminase-like cysteine peptidase [Pseudomonas putida]MDD2045948.1 transglutaminase-like cysteine peptidase [Pseudomonas putida]
MIKLNILISKRFRRQLKVFAACVFGWGVMCAGAYATSQSQDIQQSQAGAQRVSDWRALVAESTQLPDHEKLQRVNAFFNRTIRYGEDVDVWQQADYWASPLETLEKGRGDCEDFALAKYFTLRLLGIPEDSLRLVYATQSKTNQAHMVLGYWADAGTEPVVLDNLEDGIRPVAQRHDLKTEFAFDELNLYRFDHDALQWVGGVGQLPNWLPVVQRARREASDLTIAAISDAQSRLLLAAVSQAH